MTQAEMIDVVAKKLDEDRSATSRYFTDAQILHGLNLSTSFFAFLTLCFERSATLTFAANEPSLELLSTVPDFIAPLRLSQDGRRLTQQGIHQIAAKDNAWLIYPDIPKVYCLIASNLIAVAPPPASATVAAVVVAYAAFPGANEFTAIPAEDHDALTCGAASILRQLVIGGQFSEQAKGDFETFLVGIQRRAAAVSSRSKLNKYDTMPAGIAAEALKELLSKIK